jgi:hypothetical protein
LDSMYLSISCRYMLANKGLTTPPTKLQTFFPRAGLCRMLVDPKHYIDLVLCHFDALHQGSNQLAFARPVRGRESVVDLGRKVL